MAAKKSTAKTAPAKSDPNTFKVMTSKDTTSQALAKLATTSVLSAVTLKSYSGAGDTLEISDLVSEMRKAGDEVVDGNMGRIERMLANQAMTLDAIFNNMAQRSHKQDTFKGIEVLMRLALKAQAQARSTAEALALLKNPMPYIKQANMTTGPQQINNGIQAPTGTRKIKSQKNKLKELNHEEQQWLDTGATRTAVGPHQGAKAMAPVHRSEKRHR